MLASLFYSKKEEEKYTLYQNISSNDIVSLYYFYKGLLNVNKGIKNNKKLTELSKMYGTTIEVFKNDFFTFLTHSPFECNFKCFFIRSFPDLWNYDVFFTILKASIKEPQITYKWFLRLDKDYIKKYKNNVMIRIKEEDSKIFNVIINYQAI